MYELLTGCAPFNAATDTERLEKVLAANLSFPGDFNLLAKNLISRLCGASLAGTVRRTQLTDCQPSIHFFHSVVDTTHRLGMLAGGIEEIMDHPFFRSLDWHAMANRAVKPPLMRSVRSDAEWAVRPELRLKEDKASTREVDAATQSLFEGYATM